MPKIFNVENLAYSLKESPISEFSWHMTNLSEILSSELLAFDVRPLDAAR